MTQAAGPFIGLIQVHIEQLDPNAQRTNDLGIVISVKAHRHRFRFNLEHGFGCSYWLVECNRITDLGCIGLELVVCHGDRCASGRLTKVQVEVQIGSAVGHGRRQSMHVCQRQHLVSPNRLGRQVCHSGRGSIRKIKIEVRQVQFKDVWLRQCVGFGCACPG